MKFSTDSAGKVVKDTSDAAVFKFALKGDRLTLRVASNGNSEEPFLLVFSGKIARRTVEHIFKRKTQNTAFCLKPTRPHSGPFSDGL